MYRDESESGVPIVGGDRYTVPGTPAGQPRSRVDRVHSWGQYFEGSGWISYPLIDYLNGVAEARTELEQYHERAISLITRMEVLVGSTNPEEETIIRRFLAGFELAPIDLDISERAIELRRLHGLRLPDAIIWASAQHRNALLVTRNTRDFPKNTPDVRIPYEI